MTVAAMGGMSSFPFQSDKYYPGAPHRNRKGQELCCYVSKVIYHRQCTRIGLLKIDYGTEGLTVCESHVGKLSQWVARQRLQNRIIGRE